MNEKNIELKSLTDVELEGEFLRLSGQLGGCIGTMKLAAQKGDAMTLMIMEQKRLFIDDDLRRVRGEKHRRFFQSRRDQQAVIANA